MTKTGSSTLLLSLGDRESRVRLTEEDGVSREFVLALGLDAMTPGPFRRDPPTPLELEQAILVAEELLTPLELEQAIMVVEDVLAEALGSRVQSRENIERLFGQLVAMVEGDPLASAQLPRDRRFAAALLILREWMHHLDAGSVALVDQ